VGQIIQINVSHIIKHGIMVAVFTKQVNYDNIPHKDEQRRLSSSGMFEAGSFFIHKERY